MVDNDKADENIKENENAKQKEMIIIDVSDNCFYEKARDYLSSFQNQGTNISSIIDIVGTYVKGQRILYTEAKTLCEQRLSCLMIPSILFTVACSIANLILKDYVYGNVITSCLNGLIAFILALVNYLKLDARAEAHRSSAYKYDKLLSYINFQSGKLFFLKDESKKFGDIITKIERDITEIKESNQFVLPEKIRYSFPKLSGINVFTEVKRIERIEIQKLNELAKYMKLINDYEFKKSKTTNIEELEKINLKIKELEDLKYNTTNKIIELQEEYLSIDKIFEEEMNDYRYKTRYRPKILDYLKV
jgi:hypothetical protein